MKKGRLIFNTGMLVVIFILFHTSILKADHNQYLFEKANKLYQEEKFEEAIRIYEEILQNGYESWELYYNVGNAYYRIRKLGKAILYYERAYKLNPKNEDVIFNLQLANTRTVDNIPIPPFTKFMTDLKYFLNITTLMWLMLSFYFMLTILIVLKIFIRRRGVQRLLKVIIIPVVILLIISSVWFVVRVHENSTVRFAILLIDKVDVLGAPSEDGTMLFSLHEGVKFKVEEYSGNWAKIRLANGNVGWVKKDVFEVI